MAVSYATDGFTLSCGRTLGPLWDKVEAGRTDFDAHEQSCPHCQTAIASLSMLRAATGALAAEPVAVPTGLTERIMTAVRAEARRGSMLRIPASDRTGTDPAGGPRKSSTKTSSGPPGAGGEHDRADTEHDAEGSPTSRSSPETGPGAPGGTDEESGGWVEISDQAVAVVLRFAADNVEGIRARRCTVRAHRRQKQQERVPGDRRKRDLPVAAASADPPPAFDGDAIESNDYTSQRAGADGIDVELSLAIRYGTGPADDVLGRVRGAVVAAASTRIGLRVLRCDLVIEDVFG